MPRQYGPRVRKYLSSRRGKRVMAALRRRTGAPTTSSTRTLATAVGNYRYSNPVPIQMSNARTYSFWRSASLSVTLTEDNGFNATSYNLNFGFSLSQVWGYLSGAYALNAAIPNAAEFQNLFDEYKINFVRLKMFFTNNNSSVNSPNTGLPLIHMCNDFDDVTESLTLGNILEKSGVRHFQFDGQNHNGINHWVKPVPIQYIQSTAGDGSTASIAAGVPGSTWINTAAPNVVHCGIKMIYNPQGRTSSVDIGSVTFVFDVEFVFKCIR